MTKSMTAAGRAIFTDARYETDFERHHALSDCTYVFDIAISSHSTATWVWLSINHINQRLGRLITTSILPHDSPVYGLYTREILADIDNQKVNASGTHCSISQCRKCPDLAAFSDGVQWL